MWPLEELAVRVINRSKPGTEPGIGRTQARQILMQILKAGALYFALVFGAGLVLERRWGYSPRFGEAVNGKR